MNMICEQGHSQQTNAMANVLDFSLGAIYDQGKEILAPLLSDHQVSPTRIGDKTVVTSGRRLPRSAHYARSDTANFPGKLG